MPSFPHEALVFRCVRVVLTLLTAIRVGEIRAENLLYVSRLGTFPKPDFRINFTLKSNQGSLSFKEIPHGLNVDPFYVRVYVKPLGGPNSDFCFSAVGSSQSSPTRSSYGGVIFAYNSTVVRVWAPTDPNGHIVFVKDGWGGEVYAQEADEAEVVVEVWKDGPAPTFQIEHLIDTRISSQLYQKIDHELRQLPERVVVRLSPVETKSEKNPNSGFWFHAIAASQNPNPISNFGGVIFAYNERYVRLWAPDGSNSNTSTGCIFIGQEWGGGTNTQRTKKCRVETLLWVNQLPVPTYQTDWLDLRGQRGQQSFKEIQHGDNRLPALVLVQLRAVNGRNIGYVFEAQGAAQSDDDRANEYGGVVFAYDENRVRIWAPSKNDRSKKGYPLLVKSGWGNDLNLQAGRDYVEVRVLVYSSKCNISSQVLYEGSNCVSTVYNSYTVIKSGWSECSSICENGTMSMSLTGCNVASRKTVLSCDFTDGSNLCGWTNKPTGSALWVTTNSSTPEADTGPWWGHPKGSYYAYTNTTSARPNEEVTLTSPNIGGAKNCTLRFFWNMFGVDVGELKVKVKKKNPLHNHFGGWSDSVWKMIGSQGDIFWRAAFVDLNSSSIYQVRFVHTLPESNCLKDGEPCTTCKYEQCDEANVAISGIRLNCQTVPQQVPLEVCKTREVPISGCEISADMPYDTGAAYSVQEMGSETYVKAVGSLHDLIAIYKFKVEFTASYVVWKRTFAISNQTNDISFRVDEGDWYRWRPPHKVSHALWTEYYLQKFELRPGIHTISLRQEEYGFRISKLAIVPTEISLWTDLGMQSRLIPDGHLSANPHSNPHPKFGRLYAKNAWCSSDHNQKYVFFQVRLPQLALVSRVAVQGGKDILQKMNDYWITSFRLKISLDGVNYTWYRDSGGRRLFQGNKDASSVIIHTLEFAAPARGIRIYPWKWKNWICLRMELYGFYLSSEMCASSGNFPKTSKTCVGDKNCGQNAGCVKETRRLRKQVVDGYSVGAQYNTSGESCHCYHGYHGPSCEHFGCSSNPCRNGGLCSEVNNTFTCTCQPGYHGYFCENVCKSGHFGYNCSERCQCTENGSCDITTGHCNCKRGFWGRYCEDVCSPGYFGYLCSQGCQCKNEAFCDPVTGLCSCSLGWTGTVCDRPCTWNTWGENCALNCSCSEQAKLCDRFTGKCVCQPGYIGNKCEQLCPSGTYGYNCNQSCQCKNNATCSRHDGTCNCTRRGWTGVLCHHPCPGGLFGVNCAEGCKCQNGAACNRETGSCTCTSGWYGQFCNMSCPEDFWGSNCSIPCTCINGARCNPVNGECSCHEAVGCRCTPGWTGFDCSVPCNNSVWGPNCHNNCMCGRCNQTTGTCLCLPGYQGSNCDQRCGEDSYGQTCTYKCSCRFFSSVRCDPFDGKCHCKPGFTGPHCDVPCPAGKWGFNCSQSCLCHHGDCDPEFGNCTCARGWQGSFCDQACPTCGQPCPKCYHGNESCDQASGNCVCPPGYRGSSCLEACNASYYGNSCQKQCLCLNGGTCHHVTGQCLCKPGWTGLQCETGCPKGSYGHNCFQSCSCLHGTCNATDGSCTCDPGYHGYFCDRPCPIGYYGPQCGRKCSCWNGAQCDHKSGLCKCLAGWTGKTCEKSCSASGRFGVNCSERCRCPGSCDPVNGTCSCPRGFQGVQCMEACSLEQYGDNCAQRCHCMNSASCDHVDGSCTCSPGWSGLNCSDSCPVGYYGMLCASKCLCSANNTEITSCDSVTGVCNCRPGYQGFKCEQQCSEGYFGKNCSQRCKCQNSYACNFTDGSCTCKPGYYGEYCQYACPANRYGVNCNSTCQCVASNTISCDRAAGTCRCANGYTGVFCESVCPEGSFGHGCLRNCLCQNGAVCDHVNGACICTAGFKGQNCDLACPEGFFGVNCARKCICRNGANCSRFTSECYCPPGYEGNQCEYECSSGRFGVHCNNICDCNLHNNNGCDPKTGTCICKLGFTGPRCDQPCEDGYYGKNCENPCPVCSRHVIGPCMKTHGNCSCSPGYQGYQCLDGCPLERYGPHCEMLCECPVHELCHQIYGVCLDISRGKFSLIVNDTIEELGDMVRRRNIERGLERLMDLYFDEGFPSERQGKATTYSSEGAPLGQSRLDVLDGDNGTSVKTENSAGHSNEDGGNRGPIPATAKHIFMVRLLEKHVVTKEDNEEATRLVCVLIDNFTVVDGHYVDEVLSRVSDWDISSTLTVEYYSGKLRKNRTGSTMKMSLIVGISVGVFLILVAIVLFALICRRYKRKFGQAGYKKGNTKDQAEFELQPWISRNTGYLLAFDNPYYDVLAAMGLDDDIEEDYYNPLYDDASLYSDSGENTSEDGCHKDLISMVLR